MSAPGDPQPPLAGVRVVELASILAGPVTGQFLAELGAQVIKVENPATAGDPTRAWRLAGEDSQAPVSAYFSCANWGKRSIAVNVALPGGRRVVHDLARHSDIVIASYKPGDDARLGLDPATLRALNERLIYAQISAYGRDDPRPGFDAIIQAQSGFTYLNGEAHGGPVKMPVALMDLLAAHQLKEAILLAMLERGRTGQGRHVHVSLLDAAIGSLANQASNYLVGGVIPQRLGSEHPNIVPYGAIYRLGDDRELVLAVGTERQWRGLAEAIGRPELVADARFADNQARVGNRRALHIELDAAFCGLTSEEAAARLQDAGVPFGFVNDMAAVFSQPGADRTLMSAPAPVTGESAIKGVRTFVAEGITRRTSPSPPPSYNAHGRAILEELGYQKRQLDALVTQGVWPGEPEPSRQTH
jgi:crotonobetainyl-CoA:carnitine CoA-transferase CaiB-like acyl-CoA transferase